MSPQHFDHWKKLNIVVGKSTDNAKPHSICWTERGNESFNVRTSSVRSGRIESLFSHLIGWDDVQAFQTNYHWMECSKINAISYFFETQSKIALMGKTVVISMIAPLSREMRALWLVEDCVISSTKFQNGCLTLCQFYRGSDESGKENEIRKSTS